MVIVTGANHNIIETVAEAKLKEAMKEGKPIVYTDMVSYDDVAHTDGHHSEAAFKLLTDIDARVGRLIDASKKVDRKYDVVIFSDHGQTPADLFHMRYGQEAGKLFKGLARDSALAAGKKFDGNTIHFTHVASIGNLYFDFTKKVAQKNEIEKNYPGLMDKMAAHPGVGMIGIRQGDHIILKSTGALPGQDTIKSKGNSEIDIAPDGTYTIKGKNLFAEYGDEKVVASQVINYMNVEHTGDIVVFAPYNKEKDKTISYETSNFVSIHGGLGGEQLRPFILENTDADYSNIDITETDQLHELLEHYSK
jgi:hypothetical protein